MIDDEFLVICIYHFNHFIDLFADGTGRSMFLRNMLQPENGPLSSSNAAAA